MRLFYEVYGDGEPTRSCCCRRGRSSTRATGRRRSPTSRGISGSSRSTGAGTASRTARTASRAYTEARVRRRRARRPGRHADRRGRPRRPVVRRAVGDAAGRRPPRARARRRPTSGPPCRSRPAHPERAIVATASRRTSTPTRAGRSTTATTGSEDYRGFLEFFFAQMFNEPHSTKQIEDCVGWALETDPETLADTMSALHLCRPRTFARHASPACSARCCVIHGDQDLIRPHAQGAALAEATGGRARDARGLRPRPAGARPGQGQPAAARVRRAGAARARWTRGRSGASARCSSPRRSGSATRAATSRSPRSCARCTRTSRSTGSPRTR